MTIETANRLRQMRNKNGLSQEELAAKIGVSRQAVSKWERAEASPDTDNLILLARLYGVTIDELLRTEERVSEGVSLKKDDYGFKNEAGKEVFPKNYTEEEVYPNKETRQESTSVPQGSPFGADLNETERKASEGFGEKIGKAGIALGDAINTAGRKLNESGWEDKIENGAEKLCKGVEKGITKLGDEIEKGMNKFADKAEKHAERQGGGTRQRGAKQPATLLDKTFPLLITFLFFCMGAINLWNPGWTLFLLIPLYYTTKEAIRRRSPLIFCYPAFCAFAYFFIWGTLDIFNRHWADLWLEVMWLIFLTIPLYYTIIPAVKRRNPLIFCYPVLAIGIYLGMGLILKHIWWWAAAKWFAVMWLPAVISIPLYYIVVSHYRSKKKQQAAGTN